jgi:membrane fusion protein (multidrug efflux system)
MKKRFIQVSAILLAFVAILAFVKFQQIQAAIAAGKSFQMPPEAVTTVVAQEQPWEATLDAVGSVAAVQGVMLSADQPGVVEAILFESGARVAAGQALVRLDARQERAQLVAAEARRELAGTNLERSRRLLETQVIAQSEYDAVAAQHKQAEAAVEEIKAGIERKTIRAPFSGVTGIRQVNLGQYVHSGDPVVPLQSMDPIYVDFAVPQQQVGSLRVGAAVRAEVDSVARRTITGRITAINPMIDDNTRNVQVQATFRNTQGELRPGMYATVVVAVGTAPPTVALPASAINYAPYGNSVFIVEDIKGPDGKSYRGVRQQFVKIGTARGDQVAILEGVKAGQEVVSSGVFKLRTGAAVSVNNKVQPSNDPAPKPEDS